MLCCIGGLSKMIDNQIMVDSVLSIDEGLRALFRVNTPMDGWRSGRVLVRQCGMQRVAPGFFVGAQSLLGFKCVGAEF